MKQGARDRLPVRRSDPIDRPTDDAVVDRILARLEPLPDRLSVRPEFADALRARVLSQFEAQLAAARPSVPRRAHRARLGRLLLAASVAILAVAGAAGAAAAAEGSLPGDPLYGLKRLIEQVELATAPADRRDEVELSLLDERIEELRLEATAGDWASVRGLCTEITAAGSELLARGTSLGDRTDAMLAAIDGARAAAPASEQGHLQTFQTIANQLAKRDANGHGSGGPAEPTATPTTTATPVTSAEPPAPDTPGKGQPSGGFGAGNGNGDGNEGQGHGQGNGNGNGNGNGQGNGNEGQGNEGQGQGQGNGNGNGQGNGNEGQGNEGQGQGQGNGNGNGNGNGQGQGNGKGPKKDKP